MIEKECFKGSCYLLKVCYRTAKIKIRLTYVLKSNFAKPTFCDKPKCPTNLLQYHTWYWVITARITSHIQKDFFFYKKTELLIKKAQE